MHVIGTVGAGIAHVDLVALCEAVCRRVQGKLPMSQKRSLYDFVKPLLLFLQTPKVRWPGSSSERQIFLLNFLRFYLLDRECSGASTETRIDHWMRRVTVELEFLKAEQLLPPDVAIPECKHKKEDVAASEQPLLGSVESLWHYIDLAWDEMDVWGKVDGALERLRATDRFYEELLDLRRDVATSSIVTPAQVIDHVTTRLSEILGDARVGFASVN